MDDADPFYLELKSLVPSLAKAQRDFATSHTPAAAMADMLGGDVRAYLIAAKRANRAAYEDLMERLESR